MAVDVASGRFEAGVLAGGGVRSGDPASGPDPLEHPATVRSKLSKPALKRTAVGLPARLLILTVARCRGQLLSCLGLASIRERRAYAQFRYPQFLLSTELLSTGFSAGALPAA